MTSIHADNCYRPQYLLWYMVLSAAIGMSWSAITLSPSVTEVVRYVNDSYIIACNDTDKLPVTWSKLNGPTNIGDKGNPHLLKMSSGTALVFEKISADERGQYTCKSKQDNASFKLIVISPITFMDTPAVQTAQEHYSTTIKCDVRGDPKPKILWKFDGKDVGPPKYTTLSNGLKIENVTLEDKGIYTCRAYQVSQVTSMLEEKSIKLNVQHKPIHPKINVPKVNEAYGYIGGEVNLTCEAIAEPPANFTWFRQYKKAVTGRLIQRPHLSTLQLYIQNDSMFGGYMCKATNKLGTLDQIITLQKGVKPPKPQNLKVRGTTSDTLGIEIIGPDLNQTQLSHKMLPIGYRLQYRAKGENIKWSEASVADVGLISEDDRFLITGLNHNTKYEIRAATRNLAGLSDCTHTVVGHTLGLQADSVTSSSSSSSVSTFHLVVTTFLCRILPL